MIFICGHHNTGKTTVAKSLTRYGFLHIETGDIVRELFKKKGTNPTFYEWAEKTDKKTPHFFDRHILSIILKIQKTTPEGDGSKIIITGNRQLKGINYLIKKKKKPEKNIIIYLDCSDNEKLYKRQLKRKDRKIKNLSKEKFINDYLGFDKRMGIDQIRKKATHIINCDMPKRQVEREIILLLKNKSGAN